MPLPIRNLLRTWPAAFSVSPARLAGFRIIYAVFALVLLTPGHIPHASFTSYAGFPDVFFNPPPGPMALLDGFPPAPFFRLLHGLLTAGLVAVLLGYRTRWSTLGVALLWTIGYGFAYSVGKINHNILFVLVPWLMAFSGWGAAYSLDPPARRPERVSAWPLALLALATGFAFFTAGFSKLIGGWLDPTTQATYGHLVNQFFANGRQDLLASAFLSFTHVGFWNAIDYVTVLFEIGFLVAALHPRVLRWFSAFALCFHAGVLLLLNISFLFNLIVYAAFFDFSRFVRQLDRLPLPAPQNEFSRLLAVLVPAALLYTLGSPLSRVATVPETFSSDLTYMDILFILLAALAALLWMGRRLLPLPQRLRRPVAGRS